MDLGLHDKTALVLGGSAGLGLGAAQALTAEGARIAIAARDPQRLQRAADRIGAIALPCDLGDPDAVAKLYPAAVQALGHIDILVLNAGGPPPLAAAVSDPPLWHAQLDALVLSAINLTTASLPGMRQRGFGRILLIASTSIVEPIPGLVLSNALRAGLQGWAKTLAGEVARDGITVNTVMPGRLLTDRTRRLDAADASDAGVDVMEISRRSQAEIPIGRYGTPAEFGAVIAFLASTQASYVTGARIPVDGGLLRG
jgi:3-oxoacyl-[acyl-carrier protein] reductase